MSTFEDAIPVILRHEGGYVNNPNDPGGETNFGISTLIIRRIQGQQKLSNAQVEQLLGVAPGSLYQKGYMRSMRIEAAKAIYRDLFWTPGRYDRIVDQAVATKIFDFGVNAGPARSHLRAQRAANALGADLKEDGQLGDKSFAAINSCDPKDFVEEFANQMRTYYNDIATRHPNLKEFLWIWLKRASWGI